MILQKIVVLLVGVVFALSLASCSGAPSNAAKAICTSIGRELAAPPNASVAISDKTIANGEHSGDARLDAAVTALASGSRRGDAGAIRTADLKIEASCRRLGIWTTFHG